MLISSARQKDKLLLCSQAFFCLNPVPNVYSTTPVEVLLELLLLTRNPSLPVLKIYGKANFLKMLIDIDHDNLRTVLLQTPNISHSYPQGFILGPVLFNLYVADLADHLGEECSCHQYADDTTIYKSVKAKDLQNGVTKISNSLKNLVHWSDGSKLAINNDKTKTMLVTTPQMANYHSLRTPGIINISLNNNRNLEVVETYKLLGVHFGNTLRWEKHVNEIVSSCYASLAILRKLRNIYGTFSTTEAAS